MSSIAQAQKLPKGTGTFMVTVTQGGLVLNLLSGGYLAGGAGAALAGVTLYTISAKYSPCITIMMNTSYYSIWYFGTS